MIVGNDQMEMFDDDLIPAMSVYRGATIPYPREEDREMPPLGIPIAIPGHIPPQGATYKGLPDLRPTHHRDTIAEQFDVTSMASYNGVEHIPQAYGFVYRNIMNDDPVPTVPVIATFHHLNQPTVALLPISASATHVRSSPGKAMRASH